MRENKRRKKKMEKIRFRDLSGWLKAGIIGGLFITCTWIIVLLVLAWGALTI